MVLNNRLFRTEIQQDNLAHITDVELLGHARTLTIFHPVTNMPMRHQSHGLRNIYHHPEFHINSSIISAISVIGYVISEVARGFKYDEDCLITYDDKEYEVTNSVDRYSNQIFEIIERG